MNKAAVMPLTTAPMAATMTMVQPTVAAGACSRWSASHSVVMVVGVVQVESPNDRGMVAVETGV
jgi:hypothetical protein